jgi:beta-fructofuranosidase
MIHEENLKKAQNSVDQLKERTHQHEWYPRYHLTPPAYWMNDPNGFCTFRGEFHMFYQHHPHSTVWGPMHWGHFKSKDLVFWEELPIALAPSEEYDKDGCFSGSGIEKDGKLYLMYTGHVVTGPNPDEDLVQTQALAVSEDGVRFTKLRENPVITAAPEGDIHPGHFRDPKVWKHGDGYYCVLGSKTKDNRGQALLYRSDDLIHWEYINILGQAKGNLGFMWECPDIIHMGGKDLLVFSPQGMEPEGLYYHNLHQSGYLLGALDYTTGKLNYDHFELLDDGFDFYAPQTTLDEKGRRIVIAWMDMWESEMPTQKFGWAGALTIPRILELNGNRLLSNPVPELVQLREKEVSYKHVVVEGDKELVGISGTSYELELTLHAKEASCFGIRLRVNDESDRVREGKKEETVISYDTKLQRITLDREHSGEGEGGVRRAEQMLQDNHLHLRIFVDQSSVEVFINGGEKVMTARIYPSKGSDGIQFFADRPIEILALHKWDLKSNRLRSSTHD